MIIDKNVKECYLYRTCSSVKFRREKRETYGTLKRTRKGGFSLNRSTNKSTKGTIKAGLSLSLFLNTPRRKMTPFQN